MAKIKPQQLNDAALRCLADKRLGNSKEAPPTVLEAQRLLQELEVYKIELELQNAELTKARNDVEAALEKYTDLYDLAPVGYFTLDRRGTINGVNLTGSSIMGLERSRLLSRRFDHFVADESRATFAALLDKIFAESGKASCEVALRHRGNTQLPVQIEAVASGDECHIAVIDISKRKHAEAALGSEQEAAKKLRMEKEAAEEALRNEKEAAKEVLRKQKSAAEALEKEKAAAKALRAEKEASKTLRLEKAAAEETARIKSQFLANMSHELRTPMTGILGMLQLALDEEIAPVPRKYLETTLGSAGSLLRILNDILDMAKIEAGKLTLERHPFSLRRCIDEAADLFTPILLRKGLVFSSSIADEVPDTVLGDQLRLRQVLINLIGNAVKFTEKGTVSLQLSARPSDRTGSHEFTFSLSDTGIGIPDDKKELLFQAFSQVDTSHSRSFGGTGLGLAISREILGLMGGTISFESEEGVGSTFYFSIPLAEAVSPDAPTYATQPAPMETAVATPKEEPTRRLLLAEDDVTISEILGVLLSRYNYRVDFANTGKMAVELWQKREYDLVLMDVQMPLLNGFQATSAIRELERERGSHTPIVAMTAHALKEDEQRCLAAGMDAYISKPIDFMQALQVISSVLLRDTGGAC